MGYVTGHLRANAHSGEHDQFAIQWGKKCQTLFLKLGL